MSDQDERPEPRTETEQPRETERPEPVDEVRVEPPEPDDLLVKRVNLGEDYSDGGFEIVIDEDETDAE